MQAAYEGHANRLDAAHWPGSTPILDRLRSFTPVRALVFGNYGEASSDVHHLLDVAAKLQAERRWQVMGSRNEAEAKSFLTAALRRRLGVVVVREFARHRLQRLVYVGASRASVRDRLQRGARRHWANGDGDDEGVAVGIDDFYLYQAHLPAAD